MHWLTVLIALLLRCMSVCPQSVPDFRYNSARIDAITKFPNNSLMIVSNGYYWLLNSKQLPRHYNVRGRVSQLYPKFKRVDALLTDPYNEMYPKVYMFSNSPSKGLMVACEEHSGNFESDNSFCHLPVDKNWHLALKDLNIKQPIDGATWRNRSRDKDGGFWAFFQGKKLTVIDPYKMELRFTYNIQQWMSINDTITAVYYDYNSHNFHIFFDRNKYHIWKVNVTLMNLLPMGWDRAFLHGSLSKQLKINRDFFRFSSRELFNTSQPYFVAEVIEEEIEEEVEKQDQQNNEDIENIDEINNEIDNKDVNPKFNFVGKTYFQHSDDRTQPNIISSNACNNSISYFITIVFLCFFIVFRSY